MVLDTSAVVAIMLNEEGFESLVEKMSDADARAISAVSYMEASMVLIARRGEGAEADLDRMLQDENVAIVPADEVQAKTARQAFKRYGKGRHPAALNFGDCFAYALAKRMGEPLLFKGNDFVLTDVLSA